MDKYSIDVSVLGKSGDKDRYRLKVSLHEMGLYIMGMVIQKSKIEGKTWYVATPAHKAFGKIGEQYYHDITFDKSKRLWSEIEQACILCIESHLGMGNGQVQVLHN